LLDTYWDAAIERQLIIDPVEQQQGILSKTYGKKPLPTREAVRRSLVFAAKMLERESSTDLLIEKMKPTALLTRRQEWAYRLIGGLIFVLIGGLDTIQPVEEISISMSRQARREILRSLREWLIFGLIGGLIFGLKADIQTRIKPNQGIKNSAKNMVIVSAIVLVTALIFKFLLEHFLASVIDSKLLRELITPPLFVLILFGFQQGGGQALIQHLSLRLVLAWNRYAPLRYDLLLNYCTERLLLQRVGGRYRFMHKLLQDHFAKMDLG
jgi:uncharacterized membrane protein